MWFLGFYVKKILLGVQKNLMGRTELLRGGGLGREDSPGTPEESYWVFGGARGVPVKKILLWTQKNLMGLTGF